MGLCKVANEPRPGDDDEQKDGPSEIEKDRSCTDVLFLLFFAAFWVGMVVVAYTGVSQGNTKRLFYGTDYHANLCGDAAFKSRKQLLYYNPSSDMNVAQDLTAPFSLSKLRSVCVDGCPSAAIPYDTLVAMMALATVPGADSELLAPATVAALEAAYPTYMTAEYFRCEYYGKSGVNLTAAATPPEEWDTQYFHLLGSPAKLSSVTPGNQGPCQPMWLSYGVFLERCYPALPVDLQTAMAYAADATTATASPTATGAAAAVDLTRLQDWIVHINDARSTLQEYLTDVYKAWAAIAVCGFLGGMVLSLGYMVVLRYFAGYMAWLTLLFVNLVFIAFTLLCATRAGLIGDNAVGKAVASVDTLGLTEPVQQDRQYFEYATYAALAVSALVILFTLLIAPRVKVAVACLKVASQAVGHMPSLMLFPMLPFLCELALLAWFILVSALLYSAADVTADPTGGYIMDWNTNLRYMMTYHLFGLLWTNQFLVGYTLTVIAAAVSSFYWAGGDASKMPRMPVVWAMRRVARYHLGSIALGAFLVAVIQFIRVVLEYVDRKTKEMQKDNPVLKYAMCCIKCCMWYLEHVMKFINRNAYIVVAVKGTSYCVSAGRAIQLLVMNALRLAAVNTIGDALTWLGKLSVALAAGALAFVLTNTTEYTDINSANYLTSPLLPVLLTMLVAYFIASCFLDVYAMGVDTILLSFCEDCQRNDGDAKLAPPLLKEALEGGALGSCLPCC